MLLSFWASLILGVYLHTNGLTSVAYALYALSGLIGFFGLRKWWIDD